MNSALLNLARFASDRLDLAFAVLFLLIVAILMIPVPPAVIDVLVAVNLAFTIMILMTTLYLRNVLDLSTLPSIILISTVFRLALTVSSTRMILSTGDAGHIIRRFGEFVVAGNILVGLIIFLILALVQFLVVTKGAERIAEVSARFTLDALPGKQLAIDNDVRNGALAPHDAARRRFVLEKESQFFGAMDGAMRFVKGDAIASLAIAFVNLLGGLAIGMIQRDMAFDEALHVYTLLTVGEGLVSQIPAMLTAIAAAAVVTRVVSDRSASLGSDIGGQILGQPRTLFLAAAAVAGLGLVPGFPWITLLGLAALLAGGGFLILRKAAKAAAAALAAAAAAEEQPETAEYVPSAPTIRPLIRYTWGDPIMVRGSRSLLAALERGGLQEHLDRAVHDQARRAGFSLVIPKFAEDDDLRPPFMEASVEGVVVGRLDTANLDPAEVAHQLGRISRRQSSAIFSVADADEWLSDVERRNGRLVAEVRGRVPMIELVGAVRRLAEDEIPLAHPRPFLEAILSNSDNDRTAAALATIGRSALIRQTLATRLNPAGSLPVVLLSEDFENAIGSLDGDARTRASLGERLVRQVERQRASGEDPIVLLRTVDRATVLRSAAGLGLSRDLFDFDEIPDGVDLVVRTEIGREETTSPELQPA